MSNEQFLTIEKVLEIIPVSRSLLYVMMRDGRFPAPIHPFGPRKSVWMRSTVLDWVDAASKGRAYLGESARTKSPRMDVPHPVPILDEDVDK